MFIPNTQQESLIKNLVKFFRSKNKNKLYYSYSGAAGTGKTTVIKEFMKAVSLQNYEVLCMAYVGKAVMVLAMNDLNASTIHSAIYSPVMVVDIDDEGEPKIDDDGNYKMILKFLLKEALNENVKLLVVDEGSMVNDKLRDDILSFRIPTIFVGDMNQLPPIFGKSSVMENPDFVLTEIMRQSKGDPIIEISQNILNDIPFKLGNYGSSRIIDSLPLGENLLTDYDIIICGKNKTRDLINNHIRKHVLNIPDNKPILGDKIICRQNNWDRCVDNFYLVNGMIGFISEINTELSNDKKMLIDFNPDFLNREFTNLILDYQYIQLPYGERKAYGMSKYDKFEYGYCITAHLSQGSQYERVLFIDEKFYDKETTRKLRYTAVTRASKSIDILIP